MPAVCETREKSSRLTIRAAVCGSLATTPFLLPGGGGPLRDGGGWGGGGAGEWNSRSGGGSRSGRKVRGGGADWCSAHSSSEGEVPRPEPPRRLRGLPAARCACLRAVTHRQAAQAGALLLSDFSCGETRKVGRRRHGVLRCCISPFNITSLDE